jgi:hypothetical protein
VNFSTVFHLQPNVRKTANFCHLEIYEDGVLIKYIMIFFFSSFRKIHGDGQLTFNELDKSYTTLNNVAKEFWIVFQIDHYISNNSLHFDENGWCNVETLLAFPRLAKMGATRDDIIVVISISCF